jgi:hypothetical protein
LRSATDLNADEYHWWNEVCHGLHISEAFESVNVFAYGHVIHPYGKAAVGATGRINLEVKVLEEETKRHQCSPNHGISVRQRNHEAMPEGAAVEGREMRRGSVTKDGKGAPLQATVVG